MPAILLTAVMVTALLVSSCSSSSSVIPELVSTDDVATLSLELSSSVPLSDSLLLLVFNNEDKLRRLESFCTLPAGRGSAEEICALSGQGERIVVAITGYLASDFDFRKALSYSSFMSLFSDLRRDDPLRPVMVAEQRLSLTSYNRIAMRLEPIMAKIHIGSIRLDLGGKNYGSDGLKDCRLYLSNVNTLMPIGAYSSSSPADVVCSGFLSDRELDEFNCPDMLFADIGKLSPGVNRVDISLFAYPDARFHGTQTTMLILEAVLDSQRCYYPLKLNRGVWYNPDSGPREGLDRGMCYDYNLTITAMGVDTPFRELAPETVTISTTLKPWIIEDEKIYEYVKRK